MVFTPFSRWQYEHIVHHGTAGDLDRRGVGDVPTLTLAEYNEKSLRGQLGYRLFRNPLVMFGIGPFWAMVFQPRFISRSAPRKMQRSVWGTNLALVLAIGGLCALIGWRAFLLVQLPLVPLAGGRESGSSTYSTSSRAPIGSAPRTGATRRRPSAGVRTFGCPSSSSSSRATSACTTSTTSTRRFRTTTFNASTTKTRSPERAGGFVLGRAAGGAPEALGRELRPARVVAEAAAEAGHDLTGKYGSVRVRSTAYVHIEPDAYTTEEVAPWRATRTSR